MLVKTCINKNSHSLLNEMQNGTATLEDNLTFLYNVFIGKQYNGAIMHLGTDPNELKTYIHI